MILPDRNLGLDHMQDRRVEVRHRLDLNGWISVDEHRSVPCIVYDQSSGGVRVTLPDAEAVPDTFLLTIDPTDQILVCRAVWRNAEEIGARTEAIDAGDRR